MGCSFAVVGDTLCHCFIFNCGPQTGMRRVDSLQYQKHIFLLFYCCFTIVLLSVFRCEERNPTTCSAAPCSHVPAHYNVVFRMRTIVPVSEYSYQTEKLLFARYTSSCRLRQTVNSRRAGMFTWGLSFQGLHVGVKSTTFPHKLSWGADKTQYTVNH